MSVTVQFEKAEVNRIGGKHWLSIEIDNKDIQRVSKFTSELNDKKYVAELKRFFNKRSLNSNAYFHTLLIQIAAEKGTGDDEEKKRLVLEYGTLAKDRNGETIGFKLPETVDPDMLYPYTKPFDSRIENGILFICYLVYKRTRTLDSKEMARLIEGTVYEAKEMNIETLTPAELESMNLRWQPSEQ